jgi:natural product precursor
MSNLDTEEMNRIHGGKFTFDFPTCYYSCHTCFCP